MQKEDASDEFNKVYLTPSWRGPFPRKWCVALVTISPGAALT